MPCQLLELRTAAVSESLSGTVEGHSRSNQPMINCLQPLVRLRVAKLAAALGDNLGTSERKPRAVNENDSRISVEKLVARDGIEPPTLRFSVAERGSFREFQEVTCGRVTTCRT